MKWLTRPEAGERLKTKYGYGSKKTLEHLAMTGGGPAFHKVGEGPSGRVLYTDEEVDRWGLSQIGPAQMSTAENKTPAAPPKPGSRPRGRPSNASRASDSDQAA